VWSGAMKRELAQNRTAWLALGCTQRANINNMHVNLPLLKVEDRLTSSLLVFMRGIDMLDALSCLFELMEHSSDTHAYPTRHITRGLFKLLAHSSDTIHTPQDMPPEVSSQSPSPEQTIT
jgi:hypothetical protein